MADGTNQATKIKTATPASGTAAAASAKPSAAKPTARARVAKAAVPAATKPARRRAPAPAKAAATAVRKTAARTPVTRKSAPVKKIVHPPEPFVAKDNKKGKPAKVKVKKAKLVRDSFTMPDVEYALIATLKRRCLNVGLAAKKSEILRAAVANLAKLSDASLAAAVHRLEVVKTGRPSKDTK